MTDWKRKLAAYLHDPPEKAYDFGPAHKERARIYSQNFDVGDLWSSIGGNPDWSAAAADRFVFPHGAKVGGLGEEGVAFVHPISGRSEGKPGLPTDQLKFPPFADAQEWLGDVSPDWKSPEPQTRFLRAWREWWESAAGRRGGGSELLPYLPADTRCPDATIWHHCAVVSALEACREPTAFKTPARAAFLLFQVGPVQEFISQARSTRDLWSGSFLLSWLMMHAIHAVASICGPDAIIFPSLRGQPIYDFLENERLETPLCESRVLVPGIPNRFLAVVPDDFEPRVAKDAFMAEWRRIANACREWLLNEARIAFSSHFDTLFERQVEDHWQVAWQLLPWNPDVDATLDEFAQLALGRKNPIHLAKVIAESIPAAHRDERCYRNGKLDPGWAWSAHYQICQHALDARRSLRDFPGSPVDARRKPGERDALSGREEAVLQADVIENLERRQLRALFRHAEPLGAPNLIKRVWHKAYLARLEDLEKDLEKRIHPRSLRRATAAFDSVPAVAAGAFANRLFEATARSGPLREKWTAFLEAASAARDDFPDSVADFRNKDERAWLQNTDHSVFFPEVWRREADRRGKDGKDLFHDREALERLSRAESALLDLLREAKAEPSRYYAVLALDGDQIGRWLSGEKTPPVGNILSARAREYFEQKMLGARTLEEQERFGDALRKLGNPKSPRVADKPDNWTAEWPPKTREDWIRAWLACPRPLSPSWHLQFSEALANFGLHAARRIVEDVHHGQLIYSGGDDVLAMLPADEAIACATDLRAAFQGRLADMTRDCRNLFNDKAPEGFLWPKDLAWPLLVPGPRMTVSVGVAIGHIKEPLQDMIQEAQRAEKRAKADPQKLVYKRKSDDPSRHGQEWVSTGGWGRNALAVTLFKRSGEMIQWGARFGSVAYDLLKMLRKHFRQPWGKPDAEVPITGRFPYRLAELLSKYGPNKPISDIKDIVLREVQFVVSRQTLTDEKSAQLQGGGGAGQPFKREELTTKCDNYLDELAEFSWKRPDSETLTRVPRPLQDFINLFLLEAFIRRQAD